MLTRHDASKQKQMPLTDPEPLVLNESAIEAARHDLALGAVTPNSSPWRQDIIRLLNDSLATELICVPPRCCCARSRTIERPWRSAGNWLPYP